MLSHMLHESMEKVPRSCPDFDMVMMHKGDEVLQGMVDKLRVCLEEAVIANANLHVL